MNSISSYDASAFSQDVIYKWGALSDELADYENLLHPQMAALGRVWIDNPQTREEILEFLDRTLTRSDAIFEIETAVAISFLQWPELESSASVAPKVAAVVRTQWERFGSNS